jgi:integrase
MRQAVYNVLAALPGPLAGRVWPAGDIRTGFENAVEAAKVEDFTLHSCRHHFASWFVMRGGNILALQEMLGHASLTNPALCAPGARPPAPGDREDRAVEHQWAGRRHNYGTRAGGGGPRRVVAS